MKRMLFVLALTLPAVAWANAPVLQAVPVQAKSPAMPQHHPLFEVRYVLLPAPKQVADLPRIELGDQASAIVPVPFGNRGYRLLDPFNHGPNIEICEGWGCEAPDRR